MSDMFIDVVIMVSDFIIVPAIMSIALAPTNVEAITKPVNASICFFIVV